MIFLHENPQKRSEFSSNLLNKGKINFIMATWDSENYSYAGFKYGDLTRAARLQHTPESCWAAAMSAASALLGNERWDNQTTWYQTARRADLIRSGTTRILPEKLKELIDGISGFTMKLYSAYGVTTVLGEALKDDSVVLLMSDEHVVILGLMQIEKITQSNKFHVLDPANGKVTEWTNAHLQAFNPTAGAILTKT